MPVSSSQASTTIQAIPALQTRISITAPSQVTVNKPFTVSGTLQYLDLDGIWKPLSGRSVDILWGLTKLATVTTDLNGNYSATVTLTATGSQTLTAVYGGETGFLGSTNTVTVTVVEPTLASRISISAPSKVLVNQSFTISGKLEIQDVDGIWKPAGGQTVYLSYDTTDLGTATTGTDGTYSKTARIGTAGTFTLKVVYPGSTTTPPGFGGKALIVAAPELTSFASMAAPLALGIISALLAIRRR
jgi:hypothetical protein